MHAPDEVVMQRLVSGYSAAHVGMDGAAQPLGAPILRLETRGGLGVATDCVAALVAATTVQGGPASEESQLMQLACHRSAFYTMLRLGYGNNDVVVVACRR